MLDPNTLEKRVLFLDLGTKASSTFDLIDNIRNVTAINLHKVILQTTNDVSNINVYYLMINDYNIVDIYDTSGNIKQAFASVTLDPNDTVGANLAHSYTSIPTGNFRNDPNSYIANPLISNLSRLNISLVDKNGDPPQGITKFYIELVVYSQFAKITME